MNIETLRKEKELSLEEKMNMYFHFLEKPSLSNLAELDDLPILTKEEQIELAQKKEGGYVEEEVYKNCLLVGNLKLVRQRVKKYLKSKPNFSQNDIIQEGVIGLITAIKKYDYKKGNAFSTYAVPWIDVKIMEGITNQERSLSAPEYIRKKLWRYRRKIKDLTTKLERTPNITEISKELGLKKEEVIHVLNDLKYYPITSLDDVRIGNSSLIKVLKNHSSSNPEEEAIKKIESEEIRVILETNLTDREREIVQKRFGLENRIPRTLEEIGKEYGITRERVRQIESKALKKLEICLNNFS